MAIYRLEPIGERTHRLTSCDIYAGTASIADVVTDEEARERGWIDAEGWPTIDCIWWPGNADVGKAV